MKHTKHNGKPLYKVLRKGRSCHGGRLTWSLPVYSDGVWLPGSWHAVSNLDFCYQGLHLTTEPAAWFTSGYTVFAVEAERVESPEGNGDKVVCGRCRLLWPLSVAELISVQIFRSGEHTVLSGACFAAGAAGVNAHDKTVVHAHGAAVVNAHDKTVVHAHDAAVVRAYGETTVTAHDKTVVCVHNRTTVDAHGETVVRAHDETTVDAHGETVIRAYGSAVVYVYESAAVNAHDNTLVHAYGEATVAADDKTVVRAYDSAVVRAYGSAAVHAHDNTIVRVYDKATVTTVCGRQSK